MIIEVVIISVAAIVLGGTWMGLKFAKEFDPELRKIKEENEAQIDAVDTSTESIRARKKAYEAVEKSDTYPHTSRGTVLTQVKVFPQAFNQEERKRLIEWANRTY